MPSKPRHSLGELFATAPIPTPTPTPTAPIPTPTPTAPIPTLAVREASLLAPALLARLPLATTLWLRTAEGVELVATTGRHTYGALRAASVPVITGRELAVLAHGAENGRASHEAVGRWLAAGGGRTLRAPIDQLAYGGAQELETPNHRWLLGPVCEAWGLTLAAVAVGDGDTLEVLG